MEEVDFSSILSYHSIQVGDLFVITGTVKGPQDHSHTLQVLQKSKRIAEMKIKCIKCNCDSGCTKYPPFDMSFDKLRGLKGKYINTDMGKILYGE